MGICASCLGLNNQESDSASESQHLLSDPYQTQYGTATSDGRQAHRIDAEEIQRQRDALERLCVQTSDKLIDISAPPPVLHNQQADATSSRNNPQSSSSPAHSPESSKITTDYPRLFAERFAPFLAAHTAHLQPLSRPDSPESSSKHAVSTSADSSARSTGIATSQGTASADDVVAWLSERLGADLKDAVRWKTDGVKEPLSFGIQDAMPA